MAPKTIYHHRGTLQEVLLALIARAGTIGNDYLSIISNDHSRYYGLVDDSYLTAHHEHPEDHHMRLMLRVSDSELATIVAICDSLQGDMFDTNDKTLPPA
jgi:hypothetical protein